MLEGVVLSPLRFIIDELFVELNAKVIVVTHDQPGLRQSKPKFINHFLHC